MIGGCSEPFRQQPCSRRGSEENVTAGDITEEAAHTELAVGEKLNVGSNVTSHLTHDNKVRGKCYDDNTQKCRLYLRYMELCTVWYNLTLGQACSLHISQNYNDNK